MTALFACLGLVFVHGNGRIAFQAKPSDGTYTLLERGRDPALSPDRTRVIYWTNEGIATAEIASGKSSPWRPGNLRSPQFSPDGKQVIFTEMVDGQWAVMISPAAAAAPKVLFRAPKDSVFNPSWQPDGRGIVTANMDTLFWVGLDGKVQKQLSMSEITGVSSTGSADRFRISPARPSLIVYSGGASSLRSMEPKLHGEPSSGIYTYDLETKKRARLTGEDTFGFEPAWSRDGHTIYFRGFRVAGKNRAILEGVLKMDPDGKNLTRVSSGSEPDT